MIEKRLQKPSFLLSGFFLLIFALGIGFFIPTDTSLLRGEISAPIGATTNTTGTPTGTQKVLLSDIQGTPEAQWVQPFVDLGVITGSGGLFEAQRTINRAEALKIIMKAKDPKTPVEKNFLKEYLRKEGSVSYVYFTDIPVDAWYASYIGLGVEKGIISQTATRFFPARDVTRAEFLKMVLETAEKDVSGLASQYLAKTDTLQLAFDVSQTAWYKNYMYAAVQLGVVSPGQQLRPEEPIKRGEAVRILFDIFRPTGAFLPSSQLAYAGVYTREDVAGYISGTYEIGQKMLVGIQSLQRKIILSAALKFAPVYGKDSVYFVSKANELYKWCVPTKKLCWKFQAETGIVLPPQSAGDVVFVVTTQGILVLDGTSGQERGTIVVPSVPLQFDVVGDRIVVLFSKSVASFSARTLEREWSRELTFSPLRMRRFGETLALLGKAGEVQRLTIASGALSAVSLLDVKTNFFALSDGVALAGTNEGKIILYSRSPLFEKIWESQVDGILTSLAYTDQGIVALTKVVGGAQITVFANSSGTVLWKKVFVGVPIGDLLIAGSSALLTFEDGRVQSIALANGDIFWTYRTLSTVMTAPLLVEDILYIGDARSTIHELLLKTDASVVPLTTQPGNTNVSGTVGEGTVSSPTFALIEQLPWNIRSGIQSTFPLPDGFVTFARDGTLRGYTAVDGKLLWEKLGNDINSLISVNASGTVAIIGKNNIMYVLDGKTGAVQKEVPMPGQVTSLKYVSDMFVIQKQDVILLVNALGETKISIPADNPLISVFPDGKRIYLQKGLRTLYTYDGVTGAQLWAREFPAEIQSLAEGIRGVVMVALVTGETYGVDSGNGTVGWRKVYVQGVDFLQKSSIGLFGVIGQIKVVEFDEMTGDVRATVAEANTISGIKLRSDVGIVYSDTNASAYEFRTGKRLWTLSTNSRFSSLVFVGGTEVSLPKIILTTTIDGLVTALRPVTPVFTDILSYPSVLAVQDGKYKRIVGGTLTADTLVMFDDFIATPKNGIEMKCLGTQQVLGQLDLKQEQRVRVARPGATPLSLFTQSQAGVSVMHLFPTTMGVSNFVYTLSEGKACGG